MARQMPSRRAIPRPAAAARSRAARGRHRVRHPPAMRRRRGACLQPAGLAPSGIRPHYTLGAAAPRTRHGRFRRADFRGASRPRRPHARPPCRAGPCRGCLLAGLSAGAAGRAFRGTARPGTRAWHPQWKPWGGRHQFLKHSRAYRSAEPSLRPGAAARTAPGAFAAGMAARAAAPRVPPWRMRGLGRLLPVWCGRGLARAARRLPKAAQPASRTLVMVRRRPGARPASRASGDHAPRYADRSFSVHRASLPHPPMPATIF